MKNSSKHQDRHFIVVGIALAVLYWIIEAAAHAFVFHEGSFAQQLFAPLPHEVWLRSLVAILVIPFGVYAYVATTRRKRSEEALRESEGKYRTLVENLPQKVFIKDRSLVYVSCNEEYARDLGLKPDEIPGHTDYDFYPKELAEKYRADDARIMQSGETEEIEEAYIQDGQEVFVHTVKTPVRDEDGKVVGILGVFWDITQAKQAEEALQASEERFRSLVETTSDWIWEVDAEGIYTYASPRVKDLLGYEPEEVIGKTPFDLMPPDEAKRVAAQFEAAAKAREPFDRLENANLHKDGQIVVLETSGVPILDAGGELLGYRGVDRDISETKMLWDELNHQLVRDALTGVYNRRYFNETIIQEIQRADRYGHHVSFIMGDIDNLKAINDGYGHLVGDQMLQGVAEVLQKSVRAADVIIRYGGDEFLVVMPETSTEQAHAAVERFQQAFADWLDQRVKEGALPPDLPADLGFSMGVACYQPDTDVAVEEVLAQADAAMYRTKQAKRAKRATA